jgi:DNA-binding NarL/FixJ family response regulator
VTEPLHACSRYGSTATARPYGLDLRPTRILPTRAVATGKRYFHESIPRRPSASAEIQTVADDLSADELAVLKRVANGQTNDEIAAALELSLPVVERRRTAAMKKLNVHSHAELARVAALRQW